MYSIERLRMIVNGGHSQFADLLKNSEGNLSSLLSLFSDSLIFIFDSEGRFTFGHGGSDFRLHLSPDNFIGKGVPDILPSDVSDAFEKVFEENLHGKVAEFSCWLDTETHTGWFNATCSPIYRNGIFDGSLAIVRSASNERKSTKVPRKSEENYRGLPSDVPVGVFRSDREGKGTLLAANPMMATMFGCDSPGELLRKNTESLYADADSRKSFLSKMESGRIVENYETLMRRRDGSEFWTSISAKYSTPDDKEESGLIDGIITDISDSRLHADNLQKNLNSLKRTIEGTVSAMSLLVGMKDPYTSGHQKGVALLACAIGQEMGLNEETIDCLRIASTLHDLGKLNIPLEILNKPGSLNKFEIDFLRTHPKAGYDILKTVEFPWPIAEVIHQHHERQDGSGYPRGLKDDEIMMEARIIAVADVVDAVASRRPYRASKGINVALEVIREGAGTVFDKEVVNSCLGLFYEKKFTLVDHGS